MSSVKKSEKSRKAKAKVAHASVKSRRAGSKTGKRSVETSARKVRSASMPRTGRSTTKTVAKRTSAAKTTKAAARKQGASASRSKTGAAKARATQAKLKKLAAARAAAERLAARKAAKATPKPTTKTLKGHASEHPAQKSVQKGAKAQHDVAAIAKKISAHRAQAQAVLALRAAAAKTASSHKENASRPNHQMHKAEKKPIDASHPSRPTAGLSAKHAHAPHAHATHTHAPGPHAAAKPALGADPRMAASAAKAPAKPMTAAKLGFKPLEFIVYPSHGVGQILAVEEQEVAGFKLELFVISFAKDKMILKVPTPKTVSVGMRKLASADVVKQALNTLTGRARIKRTMWSRRAQEYEAKINSGDLVAIAEVVRDLYRSDAQPEQSYSERQLYEAALDRVAREIAAVQKLTETEALKLIESQLQKGPRRGKTEDAEGDGDGSSAEGEDGSIEEAA